MLSAVVEEPFPSPAHVRRRERRAVTAALSFIIELKPYSGASGRPLQSEILLLNTFR